MAKTKSDKTLPVDRTLKKLQKLIAGNERWLSRAERLLEKLLPIPGPSTQEREILEAIVGMLRAAGIKSEAICFDNAHRRSRHGGEVGNLIVRLPGTFEAPPRLLMAHVDTVPLCVDCEPQRRGRRIVSANAHRALGADNRAGVAAVLNALLEIANSELPHPPLVVLFTVQEEIGLHGARNVDRKLLGRPKMGFNFDGRSPEQVTIGATGAYRIHIELRGIASHAGAAPQRGVNAATVAALAISRLHEDGWLGHVEKDGQLGTSNIGKIYGGQATNVVMEKLELLAEVRSHDKQFRRQILDQFRDAFRQATEEVKNCDGKTAKMRFRAWQDYESYVLPAESPVVQYAQQTVRLCGGQPELVISNGGLDSNWINLYGIPTVTLGAGQHNPHTTKEYVDLRQFRMACQVALALATDACHLLQNE